MNDNQQNKLGDKSGQPVSAPNISESAQRSRRRALKSASTIAGVAAVTTWTKPVVESMVLPAHARTSPPSSTSMSGPLTATEPTDVTQSGSTTRNLADAALGAVIGTAHAAPALDTSDNGLSEFTHCISLEFPEGIQSGAPVNVMVAGPDFNDASGTGGTPDLNANGSSQTTLNPDFSFSTTITGSNPALTVEGMVDEDFSGRATGTIIAQASSYSASLKTDYYVGEDAGNGAYWEATVDGACSTYTFGG